MSVAAMNTSTENSDLKKPAPRLAMLGFNILALGVLVVPAALILSASGKAASRTPVLFDSALGLLIIGVSALIATMLLIDDRRQRSGGVTLVLPVAMVSLLGAVGLLVGLSA